MLKSELIEENVKLKERIKVLENRKERLDDVHRIKIILGKNKRNADFFCSVVKIEGFNNNSEYLFEFSESIKIIPND